jgi:hypothetical protein
LISLNPHVAQFAHLMSFGACKNDKEMTDKREGAQPAKTNRVVVNKTQQEDYRIQDALEDDEVREALKQLHADKNG